MMQEGGVILDIVLYVGICFVFGVFDLEIYFWCVVGCYSSTSRKSILLRRTNLFERDECVSNSVLYINVHKVA
jgi:hypothetical protein